MDFTRPLQHAITVVDRWLDYNVSTDPRLPGLSVGIVYNDRILFCKGYGYADLSQKVRASETTCYRIASFSKIFTTIALLQLAEQGKIALDAPVREYLPWFASPADQNLASITCRQLVTHTSGLDRDGDRTQWVDFQFPSLSQIQSHIEAGATVYSPAERWKYSNYGFTVLGEVIKQVSGMSYEEYVTHNIIERLGLELTAPTLTSPILAHLATGYSRSIPNQEKEPFPAIETNAMVSATGFSANVVDLCRFMTAQFAGNTQLLRDETKQAMRQIQSPKTDTSPGWGLGLETWEVDGRRLYGHSGGFPGFISRFGFDAERAIGVVILANAIDAPSSALVEGVWKCIHYFIKHAEAFPSEGPANANLTHGVGIFRNIWQDVELVAIDNQLVFYTPEQTSPAESLYQLRYEKDDTYRIVTGDGFGHIGEAVRFVREEGVVTTVFVGSDPFPRVDSQEK